MCRSAQMAMVAGSVVALSGLTPPLVSQPGGYGPARVTFTPVVVHPSRDVSFYIDDRGQSNPIVDRVDDEAYGRLSVYNHDVQPRDGVALLDFAPPSLPDGAPFQRARLRMYAEAVYMQPDQPTRALWASFNAAPWDPATMTGQDVPADCCHLVPWAAELRGPGWITWDVSAMVAGWYDGAANFGLRVRPSQHLVSDHYYYYYFSSSEGPHPPELVVEFGPIQSHVWLPALAVTSR